MKRPPLLIIPINRECLLRDSLFNRDRLPSQCYEALSCLINVFWSKTETLEIYDLCELCTMIYFFNEEKIWVKIIS